MNLYRVILILLLLMSGCSEKRDVSSLVVIPGRGILGVAEVGMSLREIKKSVDDLKVEAYPKKDLPWRDNAPGDGLLKTPEYFSAISPSLGLSFHAQDKKSPITQITFALDSSFRDESKPRFKGSLSFARHRPLTRADIIAAFGEPSVQNVWVDQFAKLIASGTSFSLGPRNMHEHLWFPTNGISFSLTSNEVHTVHVFVKAR